MGVLFDYFRAPDAAAAARAADRPGGPLTAGGAGEPAAAWARIEEFANVTDVDPE